jgi:hypothetical protein
VLPPLSFLCKGTEPVISFGDSSTVIFLDFCREVMQNIGLYEITLCKAGISIFVVSLQ